MNWLPEAIKALLIAGLLNLILYLAQHLFGFSVTIRYGVGAAVFALGALLLWGEGFRSDYLRRGYFGELSEDHVERMRQSRYRNESSGYVLVLLGLVTVILAALLP